MRGFIVALVILGVLIPSVFISAGVLNAKIGEIYSEVDLGRYTRAAEDFDAVLPFLHLCAPNVLLREVDLAFCDMLKDGGEAEKSRLLLLLEDLRRQVGFCPISIL